MCCLLESFFFPEKGGPDFNMDANKLHSLICTAFLFSFLWSIGGNLVESSMDAFDTFSRDLFSDTQDVKVRGSDKTNKWIAVGSQTKTTTVNPLKRKLEQHFTNSSHLVILKQFILFPTFI